MIDLEDLPDEISIDREIGLRGGLYDFIKLCWHIVEPATPFIPGWHIEAVAMHLEKVTSGEITQLVINIPPGCAKSLTVGVFWPVWEWLRDPSIRTLFGSNDASLPIRDGAKVVNLISSTWFRQRWGDLLRLVDPKALDSKSNEDPAAGELWTHRGGLRFSTSVGGRGIGWHFRKTVVDDPHKPLEKTDTALSKVNDWHGTTLSTRAQDPNRFGRVVVMQRICEGDLSQICKEAGYTPLILPLEYDPDDRHDTEYFQDPRTERGELLWPGRHTPETVAKMKKAMTSVADAEAQFQQKTSSRKGKILKKEWLRYYDVAPPCDWTFQSWDLTFDDEGADPDFVCGGVWGRREDAKGFALLDFFYERVDFPSTLEIMIQFHKKHPETAVSWVEKKANGAAVLKSLRKKIPKLSPVSPSKSKTDRVHAISHHFKAGTVWLPSPKLRPDIEARAIDLTEFPARSRNDDFVDMTSQALNEASEHISRMLENFDEDAFRTAFGIFR